MSFSVFRQLRFSLKTFFLAAAGFFSTGFCFASEQDIAYLNTNFTMQVFDAHGENIQSLSGNIDYSVYPFYFDVKTSDGQGFDFSSQTEKLKAYNGFISWFKNDYGLLEEVFKKDSCSIPQSADEDDDFALIENWKSENKTAMAFYNKNLHIQKLDFFANDELFQEIYIEDFNFCGGMIYPSKIKITTFQNQKEVSRTKISFENLSVKLIAQNKKDVEAGTSARTEKSYSQTAPEKTPVKSSAEPSASSVSMLAHAGFFVYKKFITKQDASSCRYEPTCSQFMLEAVSKNGLFGIIQGIDRLERCTKHEHNSTLYVKNELGHDIDPVP